MMNARTVLSLGLSVFVLGGGVVGCSAQGGGIASASTRGDVSADKQVSLAQAALAKGRADIAIGHAEAAVGLRPHQGAYRLLLGQSYLRAGRFESSRAAFADALTLEARNGRAALNLALTEIATGDWAGARRTLDANVETIPASDRGLAIALAGDPTTAVEILTNAARAPEADAKTRQNLALALALAGRWLEAKSVVAVDVAPDQVTPRLSQWAAFSRPTSASDQVAALLGVTPVKDPGQPVALALSAQGSAQLASRAPIDTYMPGVPGEIATAPAAPSLPEPAPVAVADASGVQFGPRVEQVQALPYRAAEPEVAVGRTPAARLAKAGPAAPAPVQARAKGEFYVQLGAYENAAVAKDAWGRATRRHADFGGHVPQGMSISSAAGSFYRLSLGGFTRADAVTLCNGYRAKGGICFVRTGAGDKVALWARPGKQMASR